MFGSKKETIQSQFSIISALIPALNEAKTIEDIVTRSLRFVDEVIVIDDGSTDGTGDIAKRAGAKVIYNKTKKGILYSIKEGLATVNGDIIITLDADGQHDPSEIPALVKPIIKDRADLVLGMRTELPNFSEKIITILTKKRVHVEDACTGFRAIKTSIAKNMDLFGSCLCGTFILEAYALGARITEVPITISSRKDSKRRVQTRHIKQILYIIYELLLR